MESKLIKNKPAKITLASTNKQRTGVGGQLKREREVSRNKLSARLWHHAFPESLIRGQVAVCGLRGCMLFGVLPIEVGALNPLEIAWVLGHYFTV